MARSKSSPVRQELLDRAFIAAMRFRWRYRGYDSQEKAIAALRRRCPGFTAIRYANAFQKATNLYNSTLEVVQVNLDILARLRPDAVLEIPREIIKQLQSWVSGFWVTTYNQAICWIMYWHYFR